MKVKKMRIKSDEYYPLYSLEEVGNPKWFSGEIVEVDEKFYKEYDKIETEFFKLQTKIEKALKVGSLV